MSCFVSIIVGTGCSKAPRGSADLSSISAIDYYSKLPESPVTYFLPPDGALAAQQGMLVRKHYVELKVTNKSPTAFDVDAADAYFLGAQGSVLQVFILNENTSVRPGSSFTFHIDTDSYLEQMLLARQSSGRLRLLVSLSGSPSSFIADLPDFEDLRLKQEVPLVWVTTSGIPKLPNAQPTRITEWARGPLGTPVITRKQAPEQAIYFYYPLPLNNSIQLSTAASDRAFKMTGELIKDLAVLGVNSNTEFTQTTYTPRNR